MLSASPHPALWLFRLRKPASPTGQLPACDAFTGFLWWLLLGTVSTCFWSCRTHLDFKAANTRSSAFYRISYHCPLGYGDSGGKSCLRQISFISLLAAFIVLGRLDRIVDIFIMGINFHLILFDLCCFKSTTSPLSIACLVTEFC